MSQSRKIGETSKTNQETFFQIINDIVTRAERENIIPVPALFINAKYAEARNILNKLIKIMPAISLMMREEKAAHDQEWKETFNSHDEELIEIENQKQAAYKLVGELDAEFRKTKVALEEEKKKVREEKERVGGDQQRKATLILKARTEKIGNLESDHIRLQGKENLITTNAGCCGLSKKKKKELANIQLEIKSIENKVEEIKNMKDEQFDVFDQELDALNKQYEEAKNKLKKYVETFPMTIKEAKDKLDDLEVRYSEKENLYQVIRNRFDTYLSNSLMFSFLQLYVCFDDFYNATKRIESNSDKLKSLKDEMINNKIMLDSAFDVLWCPNSKDRNSDKLLAMLLKDPAKKMILIEAEKPSDAVIQKIVPNEPGRILNRLKKGDLTGVSVRPGDVIALPTIEKAVSSANSLKLK